VSTERERLIAYFSMEIALLPEVPTYSGGLGVLAGDTLRAAADLGVPMVGVTLLHRKGYFYQRLDPRGWQSEEPVEWVVEDHLEELPQRVSVKIEAAPCGCARGASGCAAPASGRSRCFCWTPTCPRTPSGTAA